MKINNCHQWKVIPLYLVRRYLGRKFKFHSINFIKLCFRWVNIVPFQFTLTSTLVCRSIWFNKPIKIDKKAFVFTVYPISPFKKSVPEYLSV